MTRSKMRVEQCSQINIKHDSKINKIGTKLIETNKKVNFFVIFSTNIHICNI